MGIADVVYSYAFRTDGQELRSKSGVDEVVRSAHWHGKYLVLDTKWLGKGVVTEEQDELSLSADGKEMMKHIRVSGPGQNTNDLMQFKKVK